MRKITTTQANKDQAQRESLAFFRNQQIEITGTLYITTEDYYSDEHNTRTIVELRDPLYWNPSTQNWTQLTTQSLSIQNPDPELARSEFWARLKKYLHKRFNYLPIITIKSTVYE